MNRLIRSALCLAASVPIGSAFPCSAADTTPKVPQFSISYMDRSVSPAVDFYHYADGTWLKDNPVPSDKSRWGASNELDQRNWFLLHTILDHAAAANVPAKTPVQEVGDFYRSAIDTNRLEELGFQPLEADFKRIDGIQSTDDLFLLLADLNSKGIEAFFSTGVPADEKKSDVYAFDLCQGGLSLPDRDYYLKDGFAKQRQGYVIHLVKMFGLLGDDAGGGRRPRRHRVRHGKSHGRSQQVPRGFARSHGQLPQGHDRVARHRLSGPAPAGLSRANRPGPTSPTSSWISRNFLPASTASSNYDRWTIGKPTCAGKSSTWPRLI